MEDQYELPPCNIILQCDKSWVSEADVKFLDIHEDFGGADVLTFECPKCGEVHESYRFG